MTRLSALTAAAATLFALAACSPTNSGLSGASAPGAIPTGDFVLVGMGAEATPARDILLTIMPKGITGQGPCTSFEAQQSGVPPAFTLSTLQTTSKGCAPGTVESKFMVALQSANGISYEGGVLKLMGPTYLTFEPGRPVKYATGLEAQANSTAAAVDAAQGFITQ